MTPNQTPSSAAPITYASAGVDVEAGDRAVELMKDAVKATHTPEVMGGIGGFAGMWDASALLQYRKPLLTTSTDGVGTKVAIAQAMDKHDTIGQDLVGMVVDDIVVVGAQPLFMTDYIACGKVVPERIADIVRGVAEGCRLAGTALVGGETAEHPGLLGVDEYDVAGAATGVVKADRVLGAERVRAGDVVMSGSVSILLRPKAGDGVRATFTRLAVERRLGDLRRQALAGRRRGRPDRRLGGARGGAGGPLDDGGALLARRRPAAPARGRDRPHVDAGLARHRRAAGRSARTGEPRRCDLHPSHDRPDVAAWR